MKTMEFFPAQHTILKSIRGIANAQEENEVRKWLAENQKNQDELDALRYLDMTTFEYNEYDSGNFLEGLHKIKRKVAYRRTYARRKLRIILFICLSLVMIGFLLMQRI
jgi:type II secretory pathway component PulL